MTRLPFFPSPDPCRRSASPRLVPYPAIMLRFLCSKSRRPLPRFTQPHPPHSALASRMHHRRLTASIKPPRRDFAIRPCPPPTSRRCMQPRRLVSAVPPRSKPQPRTMCIRRHPQVCACSHRRRYTQPHPARFLNGEDCIFRRGIALLLKLQRSILSLTPHAPRSGSCHL